MTRTRSPRAILAVVGFAVFVAADDLTVVTTMLRPIINDLGLTLPDGLDDAAWIVNVYLIAFVGIMPIAGRLSDVVGRRRLLLGAFAVFLVGTIVIPLSGSYAPFLVGRILTALGGGAMVPVALAVVGDVYSEENRARALGTLGAIETLGWVWGPLYGAMLVRFLSWEWQFWLNVPLAIVGMALVQWALADEDPAHRAERVDWTGAVLLTGALVALDLALLGNAEIQSVSGLEELQGGSGFDFRWLFPPAVALAAAFWWQQRRSAEPLIEPAFFSGTNLRVALLVNLLVGGALVIAMVDVPIFVNAVELDVERSAVVSGWILASLTAAMAAASWLGGSVTERFGHPLPVLLGLAAAIAALILMGSSWSPDLSYPLAAAQLALLGAGLGLVFSPTTSVVIEASPPDQRGTAASVVMIVRLIGLSVGLAALTAWALARFNSARADLELPSITDPGFQEAVTEASAQLTADAIAETFLAAAVITAVGLVAATRLRRAVTEVPAARWEHPDVIADPDLTRPIEPEPGVPMTWMHRHLTAVIATLAIILVGALIAIALLVSSLRQTQDDLARVEAGSAIFAAQILNVQNQLVEIEPTIREGLDDAIVGLETFANSTIDFTVPIDETVVIDTEIVIQRDFELAINETIPIDETLPINEVIDTTIEIDTGLGFNVPVDVTVPVNVDVPVLVDVPVDLDLDIPIDETVPVRAEVPVNLDVPISVDLSQTELNTLALQLAEGLGTFKELLSQF